MQANRASQPRCKDLPLPERCQDLPRQICGAFFLTLLQLRLECRSINLHSLRFIGATKACVCWPNLCVPDQTSDTPPTRPFRFVLFSSPVLASILPHRYRVLCDWRLLANVFRLALFWARGLASLYLRRLPQTLICPARGTASSTEPRPSRPLLSRLALAAYTYYS